MPERCFWLLEASRMVHRIDEVAMNAEVTRGSRFSGAEAVTQVTGLDHKKFGLIQALVIERKFWTRENGGSASFCARPRR